MNSLHLHGITKVELGEIQVYSNDDESQAFVTRDVVVHTKGGSLEIKLYGDNTQVLEVMRESL